MKSFTVSLALGSSPNISSIVLGFVMSKVATPARDLGTENTPPILSPLLSLACNLYCLSVYPAIYTLPPFFSTSC